MLRRRLLIPLCAVLGCLFIAAQAVRACSIDGIASLSANGKLASISAAAPTQAALAYWAPFTLLATAPGDLIHVQEDIGKLHNSLPHTAFATPFRWSFGDGTVVSGLQASHRYARTGWYKIDVRYYEPGRQSWVLFDSAQQHVVAQGELLQANLGYYIGQYFTIVVRIVMWAAAAGAVMLALWVRLRRNRTHTPTRPHTA